MAERERETIVTTDGGGRGGGSALAIVAAILVLVVVLFLFFGRGLLNGTDNPTKDIKADVDINVPSGGGGNGG